MASNNTDLIGKYWKLAEAALSVAQSLPVSPERIESLKRAGRFRAAFNRTISRTGQRKAEVELRTLFLEFVDGIQDQTAKSFLREKLKALDAGEKSLGSDLISP